MSHFCSTLTESSVQCVKFQYQVQKPETTLDVYTTVQGTTRYHWRSATVAPVYGRWQQVLVDFQPALVANGSGLVSFWPFLNGKT